MATNNKKDATRDCDGTFHIMGFVIVELSSKWGDQILLSNAGDELKWLVLPACTVYTVYVCIYL